MNRIKMYAFFTLPPYWYELYNEVSINIFENMFEVMCFLFTVFRKLLGIVSCPDSFEVAFIFPNPDSFAGGILL